MIQEEAVMKRLTAEELAKLQAVWDSNVNERWTHEAAVSLGCLARPVLPALLAMASRLVEVESALEFLDEQAYACFSYLDPRKPTPHDRDETEHGDNFTASAFIELARELGWTSPTQKQGDR